MLGLSIVPKCRSRKLPKAQASTVTRLFGSRRSGPRASGEIFGPRGIWGILLADQVDVVPAGEFL